MVYLCVDCDYKVSVCLCLSICQFMYFCFIPCPLSHLPPHQECSFAPTASITWRKCHWNNKTNEGVCSIVFFDKKVTIMEISYLMKFVFQLCSCFRAVSAIPFSLFFPVIPWLLQLILFAWFVSVLAYPFSFEIHCYSKKLGIFGILNLHVTIYLPLLPDWPTNLSPSVRA